MDSLAKIVKQEIEYYGGGGAENIRQFTVIDEQRQHYSVLSVTYPRSENPRMEVIFMVRIEDGYAVIEEDYTFGHVMIDSIMSHGIPREQIICTFLGETLPTSDPVEASE